VRFHDLAASLKMILFCDVASCSPTEIDEVSEVLTASIFRAQYSRRLLSSRK
jgi:hypothetical protein